jgi:hypothetical protein
MNQRWTQGHDSYRPAGEPIQTRLFEVAEIDELGAKGFVIEHHYSRSYPAARWRFGLHRTGRLVGVAVFSHPCRDSVLTDAFPSAAPREAVELGRFVLLDEVPGNGETWFLGRCFAALRGRVRGVLSTSDPVARAALDGRTVFPGHIGTIYQAHNAVHLGRGRTRTIRLLPDGRVFSDRAISKIRSLERGHRHCAAMLEAFGATPLEPTSRAAAGAWLRWWLPCLTRTLRHTGNHRYAWALDRRIEWHPRRLPYPKRELSLLEAA